MNSSPHGGTARSPTYCTIFPVWFKAPCSLLNGLNNKVKNSKYWFTQISIWFYILHILYINVCIVHCVGTQLYIGVQVCGSSQLTSGIFLQLFYSLLSEMSQINQDFDNTGCLSTQLMPGNHCLRFLKARILFGMSCPCDTGGTEGGGLHPSSDIFPLNALSSELSRQ